MNKKELEKMFDEKFPNLCEEEMYMDGSIGYMEKTEEVKQFIFDELINEVLKSIIDRPFLNEADELYREGYNDCIKEIKQKAKEFYNINL